ncbi:hypothetical protein D3C86_2228210 [compost metagenome]
MSVETIRFGYLIQQIAEYGCAQFGGSLDREGRAFGFVQRAWPPWKGDNTGFELSHGTPPEQR